MGKAAFSGPVYGTKGTLFTASFTPSTGAVGSPAGTMVPSGEDWYATELVLYRGSTGSTNLVITLLDDSTSIATVGIGGSSATGPAVTTVIATDSGEYSGTKIATGSVVTFQHSSHAGPNANLSVSLMGYPRWISSTRAE